MGEQHEDIEGQTIAKAVLEAFDQGRTPDWTILNRTYSESLLRVAAARVRAYNLSRRYGPEEVLSDFLAQRVYPSKQARKILGPTARGERPLRSRLETSIGNHCVDLVREAHLGQEREDSGALANAAAPVESLPTYQEVEVQLQRQMKAVREVCPLRQRPYGAAYRESLLLRLRLDWAGAFDGTVLRSEIGAAVHLNLELLEALTDWTDEERIMPLVETGDPMETLWHQIRPVLMGAPGRTLSWVQFVPLIPTSRLTWNQWVSRGREHLRNRLGEEYTALFAIWSGKRGGA